MLKRRMKSFRCAFRGIGDLFASQPHFRFHLAAAAAAVSLGAVLRISTSAWLAVLICIGLVLTAEAFNSSLEKACDAVHPEVHPLIRMAKDMSAAAVLISAVIAIAVGMIVFAPGLLAMLRP